MSLTISKAKQEIIRFQILNFQTKYKDVFVKEEEYNSAKIIFEKIYMGQSNETIIKLALNVYKKFKFFINKNLQKNLESLISLQSLTEKLDYKMAENLLKDNWDGQAINLNLYESIFIKSSNKETRINQLHLFLENLHFIYSLTYNKKVLFYLKKVNKILGNISFFKSLEDSYEEMIKIRPNIFKNFCETLKKEELKYLDKLFSTDEK